MKFKDIINEAESIVWKTNQDDRNYSGTFYSKVKNMTFQTTPLITKIKEDKKKVDIINKQMKQIIDAFKKGELDNILKLNKYTVIKKDNKTIILNPDYNGYIRV